MSVTAAADLPTADTEFVLFELGGHPFAVRLSNVDEIIRLSRLTALPLAPQALEGLLNLRGRAMPVADLRRCCGVSARPPDDQTRVLVMGGEAPLGFVVDRVVGIHEGAEQLLDGTGTFTSGDAGVVTGVVHARGGLTSVIDLDRIVARQLAPGTPEAPRPTRVHAVGGDAPTAGATAPDAQLLEMVSFVAAGQEFALPLADVREIVRAPESATPVPYASPGVVGLTDLRGGILPLFSLRRLLGLPDGAEGPGRRVVVVALDDLGRPGATAGLVADAVRDVLAVGPECLRPLPAGISDDAGIEQVCLLDGGSRMLSVLGVESLFRRFAGTLDAIASRATAEESEVPVDAEGAQEGDERQLVTFRVDGDDYAMAVDDVSEIVRLPETTLPLPDAPAWVAGLCNLRGEVLALVDLRVLVGASPAPGGDATRVMVTAHGAGRVGLIVDAVSDVRRMAVSAIQSRESLNAEWAPFVTGVVNDARGESFSLLVDAGMLLASTGLGTEGGR